MTAFAAVNCTGPVAGFNAKVPGVAVAVLLSTLLEQGGHTPCTKWKCPWSALLPILLGDDSNQHSVMDYSNILTLETTDLLCSEHSLVRLYLLAQMESQAILMGSDQNEAAAFAMT